ncbi:glycoside hydrolase family 43 protein [Kitasatospora sp. DSM 101779]|uniref:glycoside hydrolase family 43 protein n=1 Tax=Kitasatospora sp. DSM 101779 TaxID=2853165 RepID=UPI0021D88908|nr:glycoside hydrolase family 43 protein [Kitasatospora sp. DSM 101779]MCU7820162.1 glycoside hydrolase family 43 protein [Kitasatospora sp. DSM 101779]
MSALPLPSRRLFLGMAAAVPLSTTGVLTLGSRAASAATTSPFVMAYFTQSPRNLGTDYGLHLAVSTDALQWMPLNQNNPVVTPTAGDGGLRDPFILPKQDGTYVVMATNLKGTDWTKKSPYIHVWDSADLRSFDNYRLLKLHDMATHTWAPDAFWDPSRGQYAIIYSAVNSSGHNVIMVNYTTDFQTVTAPQVFFDPGYDVIDGTLAKDVNGVNYLYFKGHNRLVGARSTSLAPGSFTQFTSGLAPQGGIEGPILAEASGTWYLWGDANALFYTWQTSDLSTGTWTATDRRVHTQPLNSKHADIKPIPQTVYDNMVATWGRPAWNRLKSYNVPDRYWRQVDSLGRIDPYPFDPYTDSQWKLVPGLADSSGVSFQSATQPTHYLRHFNYQLRLDANDGTTRFAKDATFHRTAGLADPAWSSFQSYNFPDRYIRHYAYQLRIDPISTATGRADATFSVWY